jgi:hypothetical protein
MDATWISPHCTSPLISLLDLLRGFYGWDLMRERQQTEMRDEPVESVAVVLRKRQVLHQVHLDEF